MATKLAAKYDFLPKEYAGKTIKDVRIIRAAFKEGYKEHPYILKLTFMMHTRSGWIQFHDKIYRSVKYGINRTNQDIRDRYKPLLKQLGCDPDSISLYNIYTTICDTIDKGSVITTTLKPTLDKKGLLRTNPDEFKVRSIASPTTTNEQNNQH